MKYRLSLFSIIVFIFIANSCANQETKRLENENKELMEEYNKLNEELEIISSRLEQLAQRDSILMDSIFKDFTSRGQKKSEK